jgi:hypothetical protein
MLCQTCWTYKSGKQHLQAIGELIRIVHAANRSHLVCGLAVIGLGIAGTSNTRKLLLELFKTRDANDFVAWCGVEALGLMKRHKDVEAAAITLCEDKKYQDESWARHRARAIYLLGRMRQDSETAERLRLALHDPSPFVRSCVVEALAQMDLRTGEARRQIELLLDSEVDPMVLRNIAEALGRIGVLSTVARLQTHLRHEVARTRWAMKQATDDILARYR